MTFESGGSVEVVAESGINARFDALADAQRRRLLECLLEAYPAAVPRTAAVAHVATTASEEYQRVETDVFHRHLPRLEDAGLFRTTPTTKSSPTPATNS